MMTAELADAIGKIDVAKLTQGKRGGLTDKALAERAASIFVLKYGPALLELLKQHGAQHTQH